jgi:predicted phage terminase large subunit-like protein
MGALQYVDIPGYSALIVRDTLANLAMPDAIMDRAVKWLYGREDVHWNEQKRKFTFSSGATLLFTYLDEPRAHLNLQGAMFQYIAADEAAALRGYQAKYLFSRLRRLEGSDIPIRFRCASNPPTREQAITGAWVKERYIDPRTKRKGTIFIPAGLEDNPYLDKEEYERSLSELDSVTFRQLRHGDWDVDAAQRLMKRENFVLLDAPLPNPVRTVRYWDLAATEDKRDRERQKQGGGPAFTSGVKMSVTEHGVYCIEHVVRVKREPDAVETIMRQTAEADGFRTEIHQEQEPGSSGKFVVDHIRRKVLPGWTYKAEKVTGDKLARAMGFITQVEGGNVCLVRGAWNNEFLDEAELFPSGPYLDQIDAGAGAHRALATGKARIRFL